MSVFFAWMLPTFLLFDLTSNSFLSLSLSFQGLSKITTTSSAHWELERMGSSS